MMKAILIALFLFVPAAFGAESWTDEQLEQATAFISDLDKNVIWPEGRVTEGNDELFVIAEKLDFKAEIMEVAEIIKNE